MAKVRNLFAQVRNDRFNSYLKDVFDRIQIEEEVRQAIKVTPRLQTDINRENQVGFAISIDYEHYRDRSEYYDNLLTGLKAQLDVLHEKGYGIYRMSNSIVVYVPNRSLKPLAKS